MAAVTLELTDVAFGGDAIGRYEGQVIFIPGGIPGETVRVQLGDRSKRFARGRLIEVVIPSPFRIEPPCPYFGLCGGCHWQHIDYTQQLVLKAGVVRTQLERIGKQDAPNVLPTLGMDEPWAYRNHIQLQVRQGRVGFHAHKSHDIVAIESCGLTHPLLDEMWEMLDLDLEGLDKISLRAGLYTGDQMVIFEGSQVPELEVDVPVSCLFQGEQGAVLLAGDSAIDEQLNGLTFRYSGPSFFQVNTLQAERMVQVVGESLSLTGTETLLDAYCGVGTFGLSLATSVEQLVGIESSPWAIADILENAERMGVENMVVYEGAVEDVLAELEQPMDAAVLDPPRGGCEAVVLEALDRAGVERIAYVSCDPASLARDTVRLNTLGYELVRAQPVDMFPQTYHVETVALFKRR